MPDWDWAFFWLEPPPSRLSAPKQAYGQQKNDGFDRVPSHRVTRNCGVATAS